MMTQLSDSYPDGKIDILAIGHANSQKKLEEMKAQLNTKFKIDKIIEVEIGSVVGAHSAEGAVGVAYFKK